MADSADIAQAHMEALEAFRDKARCAGINRGQKRPVWTDSGPVCAVCGEDLPVQRAEAGRGRCIECQEAYEAGRGE